MEFCPTELPLWIISLSLFPPWVSLSPSLFLNLYYYLLLVLCLFFFFFLPPVSYNLTSMLQFVSLSFIYILGPLLLSSLCMWPPPPVLRHWLMVLTSSPTHLYPHTSCTSWVQSFLCWCTPLPALTQWGFLCNSVLVSVWINVILVWHANKAPLKVVPTEQKAWEMIWGMTGNAIWL